MDPPDRPSISRATVRAPVFLSDKATLTFSSVRDESGERVLLVSWHQGEEIDWTEQMELSTTDVERLRDFCNVWLVLGDPEAA